MFFGPLANAILRIQYWVRYVPPTAPCTHTRRSLREYIHVLCPLAIAMHSDFVSRFVNFQIQLTVLNA